MTDNTETPLRPPGSEGQASGTSLKKNRLKSAGIIISTLAIGMVLGGLITARIVHNRIDHIADVRSRRGFTRFIERSIEYESPDQRRQVGEILDRAGESMFRHLRLSRRQTMQILDSARVDLGDVLTKKQMDRLEKRLRRRHRKHPNGGRDGPHGRQHRP